jgi:hypothetical protein
MDLAAKVNVGTITGDGPLGNNTAIMAPTTTLAAVISLIIGFLTIVGSLWFIFQFFTGALNWITAGSDKDGISKAQRRMTNALIGLVVLILSYALIGLVGQLFGIEILNLANSMGKIYSLI